MPFEDILISYGGNIKTLEKDGDLVTVGDYGILWGDATRKDLAGDWFTKDTFLGARKGVGVDTMLHHGVPLSNNLKAIADMLLPPTVKAEPDDDGLLVATILDLKDKYQKKIYEAVEKGALAWSSGANPRGVRRKDGAKFGEILQWPIMEFSFTPTPCEFRLSGIHTLKAMLGFEEESPNHVKAVRVLTDLEDGRDGEPGETKSEYLGMNVSGEMSVAAFEQLNRRLMYSAIYDVLYDDKMTKADKMEKLRGAVNEFSTIAVNFVESILNGNYDEEPQAAAKTLQALHNQKVADAIAAPGLTFAERSEAVIATVQAFRPFAESYCSTLAQDSIKAGQAISKPRRERLTSLRDEITKIQTALDDLLKETEPKESTDGTHEVKTSEVKSVDVAQLRLKAMRRRVAARQALLLPSLQ